MSGVISFKMLKLVAIFAVISGAYAAVSIFPPEDKPAEFASQEGCYLSSLKMVLPYDELYYPQGKCLAYKCQKRNNETQQYSCGAKATKEGCVLSALDLTKNYPECCQMEVCDNTTATPTTTAPTSTTPTATPAPTSQESSAYAYARSGGGQPPIVQTSTSGPDASASATAV